MSSPNASLAIKRLKRDYMEIIKDPIPHITAHPEDDNILVWHYVIRGPDDSPYKDGIYHGVLAFPENFPFSPPAIKMLTPNGRFECGVSLCLTISEYHPEQWSPIWSVSAVLNGLLSFMLEEPQTRTQARTRGQPPHYQRANTLTVGIVQTDIETKRKYAINSWLYNLNDRLLKTEI